VVRIFLRELWTARQKEEGELEALKLDELMEYWRTYRN
jgi:hypothetical protein